MPRGTKFPQEMRERAVRVLAEIGEPGAVRRVADKLGASPDAMLHCIKNASAELGGKNGLTCDTLEELKALRRENAELRRANESLKAASAHFAKELAWALLSVVLVFGVAFALLSTVIGITSPWLALLLMFYFLGIAKVVEPLFVLRMPRVLCQLRHWEQEGGVLRRLRVFNFGRLIRQTPLRYLNSRLYLDHQRRDLRRVRRQAESAEAAHFWAAVLFMPCIALAAVTEKWSIVAWFSLAQVVVNIYPILHLRHIRGRLDRAIRRIGVAQAGRESAK